MKLYALSDIHVSHRENRAALEAMKARPDDWLIVAGDLGETTRHLEWALDLLVPRFRQLVWVPGNHELWTVEREASALRGAAKYRALVKTCRSRGVLTPEDEYPVWDGEGGPHVIAPLFLLYDYSFRPDNVPADGAIRWAVESGVLCADERFLHYAPHDSRAAWCAHRCEQTEKRLAAVPGDIPMILVNHFPLRYDLSYLPRIPTFSIWCGTKRTEDWHTRFNVAAVVTGHLHIRSTQWRDGVRFEEVSLGYSRQYDAARGVDHYIREILPASNVAPEDGERWYR